jgi:hypothetical protein
MTYNDLPSFIKQRLWNNKSITLQIDRTQLDQQCIEVKIIRNETNNTKSPK